MKKLGLAGLIFALAACVTPLKPGAENVRLTSNPASIEGCTYRGEVKAKSRSGGTMNTDVSEEDGLNKIKNKAYDMGANVVLMSREGVEKGLAFNPYAYGGVMTNAEFRGRGEAYFCDPNKPKSKPQEPPPAPAAPAPSALPKPVPIPVESSKAVSPDAPYDFRKATWGMSKMEVESVEVGQLLTQDENSTTYKYELYGLDCAITYSFENDKLVRGTIVFTEVHEDINQYLTDFNSIKSLMRVKYGKPAQEDELWKNDQYREAITMHGEAIRLGHLVAFAKWFYPNTVIHLQISGENGKIKLGMQYRKP